MHAAIRGDEEQDLPLEAGNASDARFVRLSPCRLCSDDRVRAAEVRCVGRQDGPDCEIIMNMEGEQVDVEEIANPGAEQSKMNFA